MAKATILETNFEEMASSNIDFIK